jgi:hypothetical protein
MSRDQQPSPRPTPALESHIDVATAPSRPSPVVYWNLCQGIPPIVVESPEVFFAAQAIVVILGVGVVVVLQLVF